MRSTLLLVACAAGCSFTHGAAGLGNPGPAGAPDAGDTTSPTPQHQPCALADPALQLCLDFNDAATLGFDSAPGHHDASLSSVEPMLRPTLVAQDPAATFTTASTAHIAEDPALDLPGEQFSIELWLQPNHKPATIETALAHPQYAITVAPDGRVRCTIGSNYAQSGPIPLGATTPWIHVGCTFDGQTIALFVDGDVAACYQPDNWTAPSPGTTGLTFGEPFLGGLDNIHVLGRTIGAGEMCTLAGRTGCNRTCPGGEGITIQL